MTIGTDLDTALSLMDDEDTISTENEDIEVDEGDVSISGLTEMVENGIDIQNKIEPLREFVASVESDGINKSDMALLTKILDNQVDDLSLSAEEFTVYRTKTNANTVVQYVNDRISVKEKKLKEITDKINKRVDSIKNGCKAMSYNYSTVKHGVYNLASFNLEFLNNPVILDGEKYTLGAVPLNYLDSAEYGANVQTVRNNIARIVEKAKDQTSSIRYGLWYLMSITGNKDITSDGSESHSVTTCRDIDTIVTDVEAEMSVEPYIISLNDITGSLTKNYIVAELRAMIRDIMVLVDTKLYSIFEYEPDILHIRSIIHKIEVIDSILTGLRLLMDSTIAIVRTLNGLYEQN